MKGIETIASKNLWARIYDEISDALDLLDNTTALEGSEDSLGQAELALVRAREVLIADGAPRIIAEAPAMLAEMRNTLHTLRTWFDIAPVYALNRGLSKADIQASIDAIRAILSRIDGAPTAQLAAPIGEAGRALSGTFTAFCQETDGTGTIWIQEVKAETIADAVAAARRDCAEDWGFDVEHVHCLGLAQGDCQIVHWEDADA